MTIIRALAPCVLALLLTPALIACGDDDDDQPIICDSQSSTNPTAGGLCRVWTGASLDSYKRICDQEGGAIVDSCTSQNRVGLCKTDQGFGVKLDYVYYAPKWTPTSAKTHCENLASCSYSCVFTP